jgi:hypothetical protein
MRKIIIVLCLLSLGGCAQRIAERLDAADDAKCRSWGSQPGQPAYVDCRATLAAARVGQDPLERAAEAARSPAAPSH